MKDTFTREEVYDLLVHLQVAVPNDNLIKIAKGKTLGEIADKIINSYVEIKQTNKSALSFYSFLVNN